MAHALTHGSCLQQSEPGRTPGREFGFGRESLSVKDQKRRNWLLRVWKNQGGKSCNENNNNVITITITNWPLQVLEQRGGRCPELRSDFQRSSAEKFYERNDKKTLEQKELNWELQSFHHSLLKLKYEASVGTTALLVSAQRHRATCLTSSNIVDVHNNQQTSNRYFGNVRFWKSRTQQEIQLLYILALLVSETKIGDNIGKHRFKVVEIGKADIIWFPRQNKHRPVVGRLQKCVLSACCHKLQMCIWEAYQKVAGLISFMLYFIANCKSMPLFVVRR